MNIKTFAQQVKQSDEPFHQALHALRQASLAQVKTSQKFAVWSEWVPNGG